MASSAVWPAQTASRLVPRCVSATGALTLTQGNQLGRCTRSCPAHAAPSVGRLRSSTAAARSRGRRVARCDPRGGKSDVCPERWFRREHPRNVSDGDNIMGVAGNAPSSAAASSRRRRRTSSRLQGHAWCGEREREFRGGEERVVGAGGDEAGAAQNSQRGAAPFDPVPHDGRPRRDEPRPASPCRASGEAGSGRPGEFAQDASLAAMAVLGGVPAEERRRISPGLDNTPRWPEVKLRMFEGDLRLSREHDQSQHMIHRHAPWRLQPQAAEVGTWNDRDV
ncbi:hypothetical protein BC628DRAFT_196609 [Trametes gibbosa]|nr:hypothetical protein BC628DRAFT_196609 [Trametes gibbosa]